MLDHIGKGHAQIGTVAENVLAHGTGALNIDGCRVNSGPVEIHKRTANITTASSMSGTSTGSTGTGEFNAGRWPANLTHDGSEEVLQAFPDAARFFYCAKADAADRGEGNTHPTVKPGDLMRYLCRLVTPPGGTVLDPFAGSGSTLLAADREGFNAIGIELNPAYADMARRRITSDNPLFAEVA